MLVPGSSVCRGAGVCLTQTFSALMRGQGQPSSDPQQDSQIPLLSITGEASAVICSFPGPNPAILGGGQGPGKWLSPASGWCSGATQATQRCWDPAEGSQALVLAARTTSEPQSRSCCCLCLSRMFSGCCDPGHMHECSGTISISSSLHRRPKAPALGTLGSAGQQSGSASASAASSHFSFPHHILYTPAWGLLTPNLILYGCSSVASFPEPGALAGHRGEKNQGPLSSSACFSRPGTKAGLGVGFTAQKSKEKPPGNREGTRGVREGAGAGPGPCHLYKRIQDF